MHDTAYAIGKQFFRTYLSEGPSLILEIGSQDINGSLRDCAPAGAVYLGADLAEGPGVDVLLADPYVLPFASDRFDALVASSCFEHSQMFWLTFLEMVRVAKPGGFLYINAPSNGKYHAYPVDNWRFYPDAPVALEQWAKRQGQAVELVESFTARRLNDIWNDCVMVFVKGDGRAASIAQRIVDHFPDAYNIRRSSAGEVENFSEFPEDMLLLSEAREVASAAGHERERIDVPHEAGQQAEESAQAEEGLRATSDSLRAELDEARAQLDALAGELRQRDDELGTVRSEYDAARADRESLCAELDEMREKERVVRQELEASRAALVQRDSLLREARTALTAAEALRAELDEARAQLDALAGELRQRDDELGSVRSEYDAARAARESLRAELDETREKERVVRQELEASRAALVQRDSFLREARSALTAAEAQNSSLEGSLAQLNAELAEAAEELAERKRNDAESARERQRLQSAIAVRDRELEALQRDLTESRSELESMCEDLAQRRRELALANARCGELESTALEYQALLRDRERLLRAPRAQTSANGNGSVVPAQSVPTMSEVNGLDRNAHGQSSIGAGAKQAPRRASAGLCNIHDWKVDIKWGALPKAVPDAPIGIFAHIHYEDIAGELAAAVKNIPYDYHIYVSTADRQKKATIEEAFSRENVRNVSVKVTPNVGRDIGPFLLGFSDEIRRHDICLRLHSKKSTHLARQSGTAWRRHILQSLLGDSERIEGVVAAFASDEHLGMVIPPHWGGIREAATIGRNWALLRRLLYRMDLAIDPSAPVEFPSGSMFWFRRAALEPLLSIGLTLADFAEGTEDSRDFTVAHAVERAFLYSAARAGYGWAELPAAGVQDRPMRNALAAGPCNINDWRIELDGGTRPETEFDGRIVSVGWAPSCPESPGSR
jgi:predicted  nucleic acid-binding Zn-ribbon protein/SAM-dependent methyltransferase